MEQQQFDVSMYRIVGATQDVCYIYCRIFHTHEERHEIASKSIAKRLRLPSRCSSKMLFITLKAQLKCTGLCQSTTLSVPLMYCGRAACTCV